MIWRYTDIDYNDEENREEDNNIGEDFDDIVKEMVIMKMTKVW
jgi:hypothetical protein